LTDDRFFRRSAPIALGEIAAHVGGELVAPATAGFLVRDVAALDCAKTGELSLFCDGTQAWWSQIAHSAAVRTMAAGFCW
jgi:hypothetical protein